MVKVVDIVPVIVVQIFMYRTVPVHIPISKRTFHTSLNTGYTSYLPAIPADFRKYRPIPGVLVDTNKKKKRFFFLVL